MSIKYISLLFFSIIVVACSYSSIEQYNIEDIHSADGAYYIPLWSHKIITVSGHLDPFGRFYADNIDDYNGIKEMAKQYVIPEYVVPVKNDDRSIELLIQDGLIGPDFSSSFYKYLIHKDQFLWINGFRSEKYYLFLENYHPNKRCFNYSFSPDETLDETRYVYMTCDLVACSSIPNWPAVEQGYLCVKIHSIDKPRDKFIEQQINCYKKQCQWISRKDAKSFYPLPQRSETIQKLNGTSTKDTDKGRPVYGDAAFYPAPLTKIVENEHNTARRRFYEKMKKYGFDPSFKKVGIDGDYLKQLSIPVKAVEGSPISLKERPRLIDRDPQYDRFDL